jgi:uncharacterized protein YjbI with pentapeptide repeats
MNPTIACGKHLAANVDISDSEFHDVNLSRAVFNDVNLSGVVFDDVNLAHARIHNVNLSDAQISAVNLGGTVFKHLGPPLDPDGRQQRQRPVTFEEATLCDSTFRNVDLSHVTIVDCNLQGMTINGILVAELLKAYENRAR